MSRGYSFLAVKSLTIRSNDSLFLLRWHFVLVVEQVVSNYITCACFHTGTARPHIPKEFFYPYLQ
jgi:hypothetical protein